MRGQKSLSPFEQQMLIQRLNTIAGKVREANLTSHSLTNILEFLNNNTLVPAGVSPWRFACLIGQTLKGNPWESYSRPIEKISYEEFINTYRG
jgi:hypothetical protein